MDEQLLKRLDLIEYRQELLFRNDNFSRFIFQNKITRQQEEEIKELLESLAERLENNVLISKNSYETKFYEICPQSKYLYHDAENIIKSLCEDGQYIELFIALYGGDSLKHKDYIDKLIKNNAVI
ncbi:DUF1878 domain-containing protein [Priestia aryabhattai]|uniref:DUF1878 domain-containing protein n=1 Tax=Priestia aryabhattai TaxID=412384 RepID=UPI002E1E4D12|nr:DUF1878 domain-containing protein [Priestia aryabhattai]